MTAGATKYEDDGTVFAVDDDVVVLAGSEEALDRALERADGDDHLTQDQYEAAFDGLPDAALARVYADLEELIGRDPEARQARKVNGRRAADARAHGRRERRRPGDAVQRAYRPRRPDRRGPADGHG